MKHAYSHPKRQEADEQHYQHQSSSSAVAGTGTVCGGQGSSAAGSILPTQQQLHEIYEENLRLREEVVKNSTKGGTTSAEATAARNQYLEDERIALMLQNEEFMAELQKDSEFMSALEMEEERAFYDQQLHQKQVRQWLAYF